MSNELVEETLAAALAEGCAKLDLFFMVGLSGQTRDKAMATVEYCRGLVERFGSDPRLQFYVAPLEPFLDPGSRAFEQPELLGFHKRLSTLAEHRQALLGPTWQDTLSYETDWMNRKQIVATTYDVGAALNDLKFGAGLIDGPTHATVASHLAAAVEILAEVQTLHALPEPERRRRLRLLKDALVVANTASLVGENELKWKTASGIRVSRMLLGHLATALTREFGHGVARTRGRYDTRVATPSRLGTTVPLVLGPRVSA